MSVQYLFKVLLSIILAIYHKMELLDLKSFFNFWGYLFIFKPGNISTWFKTQNDLKHFILRNLNSCPFPHPNHIYHLCILQLFFYTNTCMYSHFLRLEIPVSTGFWPLMSCLWMCYMTWQNRHGGGDSGYGAWHKEIIQDYRSKGWANHFSSRISRRDKAEVEVGDPSWGRTQQCPRPHWQPTRALGAQVHGCMELNSANDPNGPGSRPSSWASRSKPGLSNTLP